jgi:hypothetical protein
MNDLAASCNLGSGYSRKQNTGGSVLAGDVSQSASRIVLVVVICSMDETEAGREDRG